MEPTTQASRDLLLQLLAILRALHWSHWTTHWQVRGTPAYGDHLLFSRLYESLVEEIDGLAEKIVAYFGAESVSATASIEVTQRFLNAYAKISDPYKRALAMEKHLQNATRRVYDRIKESDEMSLGLDDFLMSLANNHETSQYLLQQRLRDAFPGKTASPGERVLPLKVKALLPFRQKGNPIEADKCGHIDGKYVCGENFEYYNALMDSMRRRGMKDPIEFAAWGKKPHIVEGHHRLSAAWELDWKTIDTLVDSSITDEMLTKFGLL